MGGDHDHGMRYEASSYPQLNFDPKGAQIRSIYLDRLRQFTAGGQYESKNLLAMMTLDKESDKKYLKLEVNSIPDLKRPSFKDATSGTFKDTHVGESFGPSWSTHWFRIHLTVPDAMNKADQIELQWDCDCEGMVWTESGEPIQGLTGGGQRIEWIVPKSWRDGKAHLLYIEVACNGMFGNAPGGDTIQPPIPNRYFRLGKAELVVPNLEARALNIDFWMIGDAAREFPEDSWENHKALQIGNKIMDTFELGSQDSIKACRKVAQEYLGKNVDSATVYDSDRESLVFGTGHCHIDTCWLWPWAETKRKVARSWSSQCDLMDRYPEHRFTCSQAQQYKWLEQYYPPLFDRVKAKVKSGQFQPIGGSWVEHDTNMPSGESLVRQFMTGQRFFESHFGERCQTFWLPDTFGYSAQLPQICRLAGMTRFLTQKLSWNNINKFPHTTFNWIALDGSQVICHMPPAETYTAMAHFGDVRRSVTQHKSMDQDSTSLLVFGYGDGGGGPTAEQIEKLRRLRGMSDTTGLLPRVSMGSSVDDFFAKIEKRVEDGMNLVTWYGELYFELHRGTYTTQSATKRNNRKAEVLMHDVEYLATFATLASKNYKYPKKDIDDMWEGVCLCHFHDCLPGSSIGMCYDDSGKLYDEIFDTGAKLIKEALEVLSISMKPISGTQPVAINTVPWARSEIQHGNGKESPVGLLSADSSGLGTFSDAKPSHGSSCTVNEVSKGVFEMSNGKLKVTVEGGRITSLIDIEVDREIIPKGAKANQLVIMDDKPLYWQAWDVEVYHLETRKVLPEGYDVTIVENGPMRCAISVTNKISSNSSMVTTISLAAASPGSPSYVEFDCEVDWHESMKFLKVEFPVDIHNTEASYECQYGVVRRPTHYNTTWDMAKFEVCCHKFADLSEYDYGVAILNDCKYGFATAGNIMRLSLIRAPKAPDANADMGKHRLRYAMLPHRGPLGPDVVRAGVNFNNPMTLGYIAPDALAATRKLLAAVQVTGASSIVLDTVKRGEDDEDHVRDGFKARKGRSVVLRMYDSLGGRSVGQIETTLDVAGVQKVNVLEDEGEEVKFDVLEWRQGARDGGKKTVVKITLRPFEVATYRLQLA